MASERDSKLLNNDIRVLEWRLRNGLIKREEYEAALKDLEDVSANAISLELEGEGDQRTH